MNHLSKNEFESYKIAKTSWLLGFLEGVAVAVFLISIAWVISLIGV